MARTPKGKKITFLDPMSDEFSAAMTSAFEEGVDEVVGPPGARPRRPTRKVRYAKKKKKAGR